MAGALTGGVVDDPLAAAGAGVVAGATGSPFGATGEAFVPTLPFVDDFGLTSLDTDGSSPQADCPPRL